MRFLLSVSRSVTTAATLATFGLLAFAAPAANAQLLGTSVTAFLDFGSLGTNYFNSSNGFVPASGFSNSGTGTTTVTIAEPAIEYGYQSQSGLLTANFTNNQLIITRNSTLTLSNTIAMTFTDTAFSGFTLEEISDTFTGAGGLTASLVGNTLTVNSPGVTGPGTYAAIYNFTSAGAAPEPGSLALLLPVMGAAGMVIRKQKRSKG